MYHELSVFVCVAYTSSWCSSSSAATTSSHNPDHPLCMKLRQKRNFTLEKRKRRALVILELLHKTWRPRDDASGESCWHQQENDEEEERRRENVEDADVEEDEQIREA
ncbi:hypothetical protein BT96DRAFT_912104 [Gymnopus androsaceus JB14]|uniref:Uncharacterized protein n=1 Tax=Gymnopus androsaceus JB14 TaxID=1447944 RepID=A0A6A4IGR8_9AGAR|nr:hypothetical protein BT96DRAFT_912104 [Gymnopus androsaceus JB14]